MDYRSLVNKLEAIQAGTYIKEATAPTQFKPTHFHKGNLGNKNPVMQTLDGAFWHESSQGGEGDMPGIRIVPWQGNTLNRSAWNPASIDGVITPDGKYIDFPEGVNWKQYKQTADDDAALMAKLKKLMELIEKYNALRAKRGQGARPAGPTTRDMGDGSRLTTDDKGNVASTDTDGNAYIPGSNPNLPQNKVKESINYKSGIAQNLVESFGYEVSGEHTDEGVGALLGRAAPGVGAVLGAQGAYDSYKKGDYLGAALNGLSGAFSLVPGLGWIPALGLGAYQAGRELSGATDKYNKPKDGQQGGQQGGQTNPPGAGPVDPKVKALQQRILAKDPKALPKYGADGRMGPETRAAMQRLKIQETTMPQKSLAETMRELQQRLELIETETNDATAQVQPASSEQQALGAEIEQAGGKLYLLDGNGYVVMPDGKTVVDLDTKEIVDASTPAMTPTGQTVDLSQLSENMGLDEGIWDNIFKGAVNAFKTGASGAKVATGNLTRAGNPQVVGQGTKIFQKQLATQPALARGAYRAGQGVKAVKNNPLTTAAGLTAAGLAGGYASGKLGGDGADTPPVNPPVTPPIGGGGGSGSGSSGSSGGSSGGSGGNPNPPDTAADDAEMAALKAQIEALIKELSTSKNPEIQKGLAAAQEKLK